MHTRLGILYRHFLYSYSISFFRIFRIFRIPDSARIHLPMRRLVRRAVGPTAGLHLRRFICQGSLQYFTLYVPTMVVAVLCSCKPRAWY